MEKFQVGDLITYRLHGDDFGLAQVLVVDDLALHDYYHLALLDGILKAEEDGVDSYGVPYERRHTLDGAELAPVVVDHIALTVEALAESDPVKVGERAVSETDLIGYRAWMMGMRELLVRQGIIRESDREEDEYDDEYEEEDEEDLEEIAEEMDEEDLEPKTSDDQILDEEDDDDDEEDDEDDDDDDEDRDAITIELRPWHQNVYGGSLDTVIFRMHEEFKRPELMETRLGTYIASFFDGSNMDEINEMVNRFVEGDYGAGHELLAFGEVAVGPLAAHLQDGMDPQLADDILNVLCDSGTMRAYEQIAAFFAQHEGNPADPLGLPAARGYAYAVMLTGGVPEPLREHLPELEDIAYPELEHDVAAAMQAVISLPKEIGE